MHRNTKVATCCYCGMRAALVLGHDRHELVCAGCGAPLHNLKALPISPQSSGERKKAPTPDWLKERTPGPYHGRKSYKKRKKRKSFGKKMFEEVFDLIEDVFD